MSQIAKILALYDKLGGIARARSAVEVGAGLVLGKPAGPENFCSSCAFRGAPPSFSLCDACVTTAQGQKLNWTDPRTLEVPNNPGLNAKPEPEPEPEPDTPVVPAFDPDVFLMMAPFSMSLADARAQARAQLAQEQAFARAQALMAQQAQMTPAQIQAQLAQFAQAHNPVQSAPDPAPADEPDTPVVPVFDDEVLL